MIHIIILILLSICLTASAREKQPPSPAIAALAITPDGKALIRGSQKGVSRRSLAGGEEEALPVRLDHVLALAFSSEGSMLAVAGGSPAEAGAVEILSWPTRKPLYRLEGHKDVVHAVAWLRGGKALATASADRTVRIWEAETGKLLKELSGHSGPVLALAVSPDGKLLCSGSADQTIRVWDVADGRLLHTLSNHLGPVHQLAFRPGGAADAPADLASAGGDSTVRVWQPAIGRMVRIVRHPSPVLALAWASDSARLYSGGADGCLRVLNGDSDKIDLQRQLFSVRITSIAVVPTDGRVLAGSARGEIRLESPRNPR